MSASRVAEARQTASFVHEQFSRLSEAQREVLLLCSVRGLSQAEVSEVLDMPVPTVKTNLRRARLALAAALGRREIQARREVGE